jgi:hypothetical protein
MEPSVSRLPDGVLNDFDGFLARTNIRRMDAKAQMADQHGDSVYSVNAGGGATFDFHRTELAPPTGMFAKNYSRSVCVSAVHFKLLPIDKHLQSNPP